MTDPSTKPRYELPPQSLLRSHDRKKQRLIIAEISDKQLDQILSILQKTGVKIMQ